MMNINDANTIFERYKPQFDALNALIYSQSPAEDLIMLRWWIHLTETGDMQRLITPKSRRLPAFLSVFKFPTALIYSLDAMGEIDNAFWATPEDDHIAYCGLWCREDVRGKRRQFDFTSFVYTFAFEFYSALLGTTWQADLLDIHQKLGYNVIGCIPKLYDEDFVYIVHLTREAFQASHLAKVRRQ